MKSIIKFFASGQGFFIDFIRVAIFVVMVWIGGLKAFNYEAEGIVPFVINSPFMKFFYHNTGNTAKNDKGETVAEYNLYKNLEGKTVQKNIDWHESNGTYTFSYGLGSVIVIIGLSVLLGIWFPRIGFWGGILTAGMSITTLTFLITTPEVYVPNLGGDFQTPQYGFPYLSGAGRLVIKDIIMLAGGLIIASNSAQKIISSSIKS
jgi:uncharacterized membrane protein YkgB